MTQNELLKALTHEFEYRKDDHSHNLAFINWWIKTSEGFEEYKDYINYVIGKTDSAKELSKEIKELTIENFIEEMLESGDIQRVMNDIRDRADDIWRMVLLNLKSKHKRVYYALEGDKKYTAQLENNNLLIYKLNSGVVESYNMDYIWKQILQQANYWGYDWMDTDITTVAGIVK